MELFLAIALGSTILLSPAGLLIYGFLKSCEKGRLAALNNLSNHPELVELSEIRNDYEKVEIPAETEIKKKSFLEIMF
ncbi:MAG: hypothetical protein ACK52E_16285 [Aphanizomenon sp.]|jgi:hypothetical protein